MTSQILSEALRDLALCVKAAIEQGESGGEIAPEKRSSLRNTVENFDYETLSHSSRPKSIVEVSWSSSVQRIVGSIIGTRKYASALEHVENAIGKQDSSRYLDFFVERLVKEMLENPDSRTHRIDETVTTFVKDLHGEPLPYLAESKLDGLMLRPDHIQIDPQTHLRRTTPDDMEKEAAMFIGIALARTAEVMPSAILEIELVTRGGNEIHEEIGRAITTLRLFRTGSVRLLRSSYYSASVIDKTAGAMILGNRFETTLWRYWISERDVELLKDFWQTMTGAVRILVTPTRDPLFTAVAYNHYSTALLRSASLQSLIAEAVEGLEALFTSDGEGRFIFLVRDVIARIRGEETGHVVHNLRQRTGRVLESLGMEPAYVKKVVNDAYAVRSSKTHGGILDQKEERRIIRRYGSCEQLLRLILDYLRICLVVALLHGKTKEEFIDLVDRAWVDVTNREALNQMGSRVKPYAQTDYDIMR